MSSTGGAGSGNRVGAAGQDSSKDGSRQSKRPKKENDTQKWKQAVRDVYYKKCKFPPVDDHEAVDVDDYVPPPILVFLNAKGGTLKTTHTWTTAYLEQRASRPDGRRLVS